MPLLTNLGKEKYNFLNKVHYIALTLSFFNKSHKFALKEAL
jgi:hypothetical protein